MEQIGTALQQLIDMVKSLAPDVWAIYLRQIFVSAVMWSVFSVGLLGFDIWVLSLLIRYKKPKNEENNRPWLAVGLIFLMIATVVSAGSAFGRFYNPGYYAIQALILTATGK